MTDNNIEKKLDQILEILGKLTPPKKIKDVNEQSRKGTILHVFQKLCGYSAAKRATYKFPRETIAEAKFVGAVRTEPVIEIVPLSLFLNQCEQRAKFDPQGTETSRRDNARAILEKCDELVVTTLDKAGLRAGGDVYVVMSRREAIKRGLVRAKAGEDIGPDPEPLRKIIGVAAPEKPAVSDGMEKLLRTAKTVEKEEEIDDTPPVIEQTNFSEGDLEEEEDRKRDALAKIKVKPWSYKHNKED